MSTRISAPRKRYVPSGAPPQPSPVHIPSTEPASTKRTTSKKSGDSRTLAPNMLRPASAPPRRTNTTKRTDDNNPTAWRVRPSMLSEADFFGGLEEDRRLFENVLSATNVAVKRKKVRPRPTSAYASGGVTPSLRTISAKVPLPSPTKSNSRRELSRPAQRAPPSWEDSVEREVGGGRTSTRTYVDDFKRARCNHNGVSTANSGMTKNRNSVACGIQATKKASIVRDLVHVKTDNPQSIFRASYGASTSNFQATTRGEKTCAAASRAAGGCGSAAAVGRPYLGRAERAAESAKELAVLRREVGVWRAEASAAREEATTAKRTLDEQQEHIEFVLRQTAQHLPAYTYGLDLKSVNPLTTTSRSNGKSLVFEHRAELEKSVVIGRLRGEVSRLKEQMIATEAELTDVKRSCQSTALAEMMAAGEEYMIEVDRLRAVLDGKTSARRSPSRGWKAVSIPNVSTNLSNTGQLILKPSTRSASTNDDGNDDDYHKDRDGKTTDNNLAFESESCSTEKSSSRPFTLRPGARVRQKEMSTSPSWGQESKASPSPTRSHSTQVPMPAPTTGEAKSSTYSNQTVPNSDEILTDDIRVAADGRFVRDAAPRHKCCRVPPPRSCYNRGAARLHNAPALPADTEGRRRRIVDINSPVRGWGCGGTSSRKGAGIPHGVGGGVSGGGGGAEEGGMMAEKEVDVLKGLVLAQQQRIGQQREKMQMLEIDLRNHRRAAMGLEGGERCMERVATGSSDQCFLQRSKSGWTGIPANKSSSSPGNRRKATLPCRSAPARLDHFDVRERTELLKNAVRSTTAAYFPGTASGGASDEYKQSTSTNPHNSGAVVCEGLSSADATRHTDFQRKKMSSRMSSRNTDSAEAEGMQRHQESSNEEEKGGKLRRISAKEYPGMMCDAVGETTWGTNGGMEIGEQMEVDLASQTLEQEGRAEIERDDSLSLPKGWTEVVDEDTGHNYYFSETRSTWIRPTNPATPRGSVSSPSAVTFTEPREQSFTSSAAIIPEERTSRNHAAGNSADLVSVALGLANTLRSAAKDGINVTATPKVHTSLINNQEEIQLSEEKNNTEVIIRESGKAERQQPEPEPQQQQYPSEPGLLNVDETVRSDGKVVCSVGQTSRIEVGGLADNGSSDPSFQTQMLAVREAAGEPPTHSRKEFPRVPSVSSYPPITIQLDLDMEKLGDRAGGNSTDTQDFNVGHHYSPGPVPTNDVDAVFGFDARSDESKATKIDGASPSAAANVDIVGGGEEGQGGEEGEGQDALRVSILAQNVATATSPPGIDDALAAFAAFARAANGVAAAVPSAVQAGERDGTDSALLVTATAFENGRTKNDEDRDKPGETGEGGDNREHDQVVFSICVDPCLDAVDTDVLGSKVSAAPPTSSAADGTDGISHSSLAEVDSVHETIVEHQHCDGDHGDHGNDDDNVGSYGGQAGIGRDNHEGYDLESRGGSQLYYDDFEEENLVVDR